ncbi:hypothetical protein V8G54_023733 [Vigna mungo]|uniref:Uncharacterized protein n=1 Tax=Vigna mungo TaxID=3915 RepID=A0AAQ3RQL9_VIGMU
MNPSKWLLDIRSSDNLEEFVKRLGMFPTKSLLLKSNEMMDVLKMLVGSLPLKLLSFNDKDSKLVGIVKMDPSSLLFESLNKMSCCAASNMSSDISPNNWFFERSNSDKYFIWPNSREIEPWIWFLDIFRYSKFG